MTVLQALQARYHQFAIRGDLPVVGFAPAKISFCIVIDRDGLFVSVEDVRIGRKNDVPIEIEAPQAPNDRRGEKVVACLLWDPIEYALGIPNLAKERNEQGRLKAIRNGSGKI